MIDIQGELVRVFSKYLSIIEPVGYANDDFERAEPETLITNGKNPLFSLN